MRFLGGFLKFLGILILLAATVVCTAVSIEAAVPEAYWTMGGVWALVLFVTLNIWGTGIALTRLRKLEKKVEKLEQRFQAAPPVQMSAAESAPIAQPEIPAAPVSDAPQRKKSRVWIPLVISVVVAAAAIVALILTTGDKDAPSDNAPLPEESQVLAPTEGPAVHCGMTINGICVDDSYVDEDGKPLKLVYLFYTISADSGNQKIDSKYTQMFIGSNQYESDHFADVAAACKYTPNYYYGSYIQDVYVGTSMNVIATFYIPEGDLEPGKTVTLQDSQIPGIEAIHFTTDEFQHFATPEEIAMTMDPEGYEMSMYAREEADDATTKLVRDQLNGRYWSFFVNNLSYKLEFSAKNKFSLTTSFGTQSGTYSVRNGYVFCTYPDTGYTVEIPYEIVDGKVDLDTIAGFDVFA